MRVWMLVLVVVGIFGAGVLAFPLVARHTEPHPHYVAPTSDVREIAKAMARAAIMYAQESQEPSRPARDRRFPARRTHLKARLSGKPEHAAPSTHRNSHGWPLFVDQVLARRFLATAPAQGVEGALYLVEMQSYDAPTLDLLVSIYTDNNGHLGDTTRTALGATPLMIGPPGWERQWVPYRSGQSQTRSAPRLTIWKARDTPCEGYCSLPCKLEGGNYYWLVIEPNWLPQSADEPDNFVVLLTERSTRPTTIHRVFHEGSLPDRRLEYSDHTPYEGRLEYSDYTRNEDIVVNITLDGTHASVDHLPPGKK